MEITVLLEPKEGQGYRASSGSPLATEAEGISREEALCNLRTQIEHKIRSGAEILTLKVFYNIDQTVFAIHVFLLATQRPVKLIPTQLTIMAVDHSENLFLHTFSL